MALQLYNSLSKQVQEFSSIDPQAVKMYTCGPTVYSFAHIGNFRTFALSDFLLRVLKFNGYSTKFIMNITDVGHLTGDNEGDADTGDDRLEVSAKKEGKSVKDIVSFYTNQFIVDYEKLNLTKPEKFTPATQYIKEQIDLVRRLKEKGFTYQIDDGVYFDTSKFKDYGHLSGLTEESVKEGARVEPNPQKRHPLDFALWKLSPPYSTRWQEWESPWGKGFPGWHLECSAMIFKELGEQIDIHIGGEDHKSIHHQNEIAQSEGASGKKFSQFWMHVTFLQVDGGKMGKSLNNTYTLADLESKRFLPASLRYFYMTGHYRKPLNFTWESLTSAQNSLKKLYEIVSGYNVSKDSTGQVSAEFLQKFERAINDDLNMPKALSVAWDLVKSDLEEDIKVATLLKFDEVLGFGFDALIGFEVPKEVGDLARTRWEYKKVGIWDKADYIRRQIDEMGFTVDDTAEGYRVKKKF
ncbi:cysteine--tRNA ligase [candidate division WWE3 bacterium CG08_land_8_20_14_0_20_41_10]|uniref:Cysteine--tRNA ligase n=1 Tax=candidate division WWE3 bacterium CG08_land_8_20_14_0_20_41_10 TaxID=1975085 RepID=A0A2H0XCW6_UNCKA|nr:MAG: cysteine--tRNA ligase [candidate division WWE3 bacterium CG08_land_8_20_14_0_20_41_10]